MVLTFFEKAIAIYHVIRDAIQPMTESGFSSVVFSREFSILFMEEFGGLFILFCMIMFPVFWLRLSSQDHRTLKQFQTLEELIRNPGTLEEKPGETREKAGLGPDS